MRELNVVHWPSQYCWPEGFMLALAHGGHARASNHRHAEAGAVDAGVVCNFITNIHIGREVPHDRHVLRLVPMCRVGTARMIRFWMAMR